MKFDVLLDKAKFMHDECISKETYEFQFRVMYIDLYYMLLEFKKQKALCVITNSLRKEIDETCFTKYRGKKERMMNLYFRIRWLYLANFKRESEQNA